MLESIKHKQNSFAKTTDLSRKKKKKIAVWPTKKSDATGPLQTWRKEKLRKKAVIWQERRVSLNNFIKQHS